MQVSDLTGSYRLYRKECLDQLMALCTSKVGWDIISISPHQTYLWVCSWCALG
jgi:hypothetical protein